MAESGLSEAEEQTIHAYLHRREAERDPEGRMPESIKQGDETFAEEDYQLQCFEIVSRVLILQFGMITTGLLERLYAMPCEELIAICKALITAKSLQELGLSDA